MKRIIFTGAALMAIVPASMGFISNASFSQSIPLRVPAHVIPVSSQSSHLEPGDDKGGHGQDDRIKVVRDDGSGHK